MEKYVVSATILGIALLLGIMIVSMGISYNNSAVDLENRFTATKQKVQGSFDTMWKIIEGKAGVAIQYKSDFLNALNSQVRGREGGAIAKFVQEVAPGLDPSVYRDVSNSIESYRVSFLNAQLEVVSIQQEHNNLRQKIPSKWFVGDRAGLEYKLVTSTRTEKTFESGQDNANPNPFAR